MKAKSRNFGLRSLTVPVSCPPTLTGIIVALITLILATTGTSWAQGELDARIIIETNFTDRDSGIQIFNDGDPWRKVEVKDPDGKKILDVAGKGNLKIFGLTELFLESNEPNFDDMSLIDILNLFPEGEYRFKGASTEEEKLVGTAELSHEIPCAPANLSPSGGAVVSSGGNVVITWSPVLNMLDNEAETCSGGPITIERYEVIVENLDSEREFDIFLDAKPADNQVTIPGEFVTSDSIYKYEVLAIAENGNQTIAETFFCTDLEAEECVLPED